MFQCSIGTAVLSCKTFSSCRSKKQNKMRNACSCDTPCNTPIGFHIHHPLSLHTIRITSLVTTDLAKMHSRKSPSLRHKRVRTRDGKNPQAPADGIIVNDAESKTTHSPTSGGTAKNRPRKRFITKVKQVSYLAALIAGWILYLKAKAAFQSAFGGTVGSSLPAQNVVGVTPPSVTSITNNLLRVQQADAAFMATLQAQPTGSPKQPLLVTKPPPARPQQEKEQQQEPKLQLQSLRGKQAPQQNEEPMPTSVVEMITEQVKAKLMEQARTEQLLEQRLVKEAKQAKQEHHKEQALRRQPPIVEPTAPKLVRQQQSFVKETPPPPSNEEPPDDQSPPKLPAPPVGDGEVSLQDLYAKEGRAQTDDMADWQSLVKAQSTKDEEKLLEGVSIGNRLRILGKVSIDEESGRRLGIPPPRLGVKLHPYLPRSLREDE